LPYASVAATFRVIWVRWPPMRPYHSKRKESTVRLQEPSSAADVDHPRDSSSVRICTVLPGSAVPTRGSVGSVIVVFVDGR
jgi:hypothetical protein